MAAGDNNNLDRWLDTALRQYGSAGPRTGLEGRIVTRLAAEVKRKHATKRWRWGLVVASAACLMAAIWVGIGHQGLRQPENIKHLTTSDFSGSPPVAPVPVAAQRHTRHIHERRAAAGPTEPRLDRFPSPRPLSEEELLFANYADRFPNEAMLLAEEQRSFHEGTRRAEQEARNSVTVSDQER
jgi:hypothetical protein